MGGTRDLSGGASSSPALPPRPNLEATTGIPVTSPGFAKRIFGGVGIAAEFEEDVPAVDPDVEPAIR